jgi:hypothetical protein
MEVEVLPLSLIAMLTPILLQIVGYRHQQIAVRDQLRRRQKGEVNMPNELLQSLVGKVCNFSVGPLESFRKVKVVEVAEHWIRVQDGNRQRLINSEYVTSVQIVKEK